MMSNPWPRKGWWLVLVDCKRFQEGCIRVYHLNIGNGKKEIGLVHDGVMERSPVVI